MVLSKLLPGVIPCCSVSSSWFLSIGKSSSWRFCTETKHKITPGKTQKLPLEARSCSPERGENYLEGSKVNTVSNGMGRDGKGREGWKEKICFSCAFGQFVIISSLHCPGKQEMPDSLKYWIQNSLPPEKHEHNHLHAPALGSLARSVPPLYVVVLQVSPLYKWKQGLLYESQFLTSVGPWSPFSLSHAP